MTIKAKCHIHTFFILSGQQSFLGFDSVRDNRGIRRMRKKYEIIIKMAVKTKKMELQYISVTV